MEEIRGLSYGLQEAGGTLLKPYQVASYLYGAGFTDAKVLTEACAVMKAESGWWTRAFHFNLEAAEDGTIWTDEQGRVRVKSVDLGLIQRNVKPGGDKGVLIPKADLLNYAKRIFENKDAYGWLDRPARAAKEAYDLYSRRGFKPWAAYNSDSHLQYLDESIVAVGNFLGVEYGFGQGFVVKRKP